MSLFVSQSFLPGQERILRALSEVDEERMLIDDGMASSSIHVQLC